MKIAQVKSLTSLLQYCAWRSPQPQGIKDSHTPAAVLKLLMIMWGVIVATTAFGQATTYIWTNQFPSHPTGGDLGSSITNWDPNALPNGGNGDTMEWNGSTTGNLALTINGGLNGNSGNIGLTVYMNASQTGNLQIGPVAGLNSSQPRWNNILIDNGAGQFVLGDDSLNSLEIVWGSAFTQTMENNSTHPAIVKPNILFRNGGGGTHFWNYRGTGDWILNNYNRCDNSGNGAGVIKDGTGTLTWTGTNVPAATVNGVTVGAFPAGLQILGGTVIMKSPDLITSANIQLDTSGAGGTLLKYDAPTGAGNFSGTVSGFGPIQVNAGTLTLSGANTYTGSNYLTGGELIVFRAENLGVNGPLGVGGVITFAGGTLGFSTANTFDYSPRFDTSAGQQYKLDVPSGASVTIATALTSSGGSFTKSGGGSLTLSGANTYSGPTTVSAGNLTVSGTLGSGNITVADGQSLTVVENGNTVHPAAMTLGTAAGVTLGFNNLTNTTTAPIAVSGAISAGGPISVSINSGVFNTIGTVFPLISWGSGLPPAVNNPPSVSGAAGVLSTNGNTIVLTITATPYVWTGGASPTWDASTSGNWKQSGNPVTWQNAALTLFDDTATGNTNVIISGDLLPASVTVDSDVLNYTITSSLGNIIDGTGGLTMSGNSTLTLAGGVNAYTGPTTVSGGTLSVGALANGSSPSDIGASGSGATNLVLNGGVLQYTGGGATIDREFSVGLNGGTIDASGSAALNLAATKNVALVGSGSHPLKLRGTNTVPNTLAANIGDSSGGPTSLTKDGPNTWILTGTNTYSGGTTLHNGGTLQIGIGGGSGSIGSGSINLNNNSALNFNRAGTLTVSGAITGAGSLTNNGPGTLILTGNSTYSGDTLNNAGTLQLGSGGSTGTLNGGANITNNSMLIFNTTGNPTYTGGGIHGTGNVEFKTGTVKAIGNNDYTGWTLIDSGATFIPTDDNAGNPGTLSSSVVTNNGTLLCEGYITRTPYYGNIVGTGKVQVGVVAPWTGNDNTAQEAATTVLAGTNTYSGGTFIGGANLQFGDAITPGAGSFVGNISFVNNFASAQDSARRVIFNRPDDFTVSGNIVTNYTVAQTHFGVVELDGVAVVTFTGNNTYAGATYINGGTLQIGNGGASGTIGFGPITVNGLLIFNRSDDSLVVPGAISGVGFVTKIGAGSVSLTSTGSTYTGVTTISNGTLAMFSTAGDINVEGGTLAPGGLLSVGTLTVGGSLIVDSGGLSFALNRSLAQSNSFVTVSNAITIASGTKLKLLNVGPTLQVGDKFTLFSQPVAGGAGMTITSPGYTFANNLAVDGSVTVTAATPFPTLTTAISGGNITIGWPAAWTGAFLQVQTNTLAAGLKTNWVTVPGSDAVNSYTSPLNKTGAVFYRLIP